MAGMKWMIVKEVEVASARSPDAPTQKIYYFLTKLWEEYVHDPLTVSGSDAFLEAAQGDGCPVQFAGGSRRGALDLGGRAGWKLIIVTEDEQYGRSFTP